VLADKLPVRMQVQLHKILWGTKPGVWLTIIKLKGL
jgi:7-carboxy-7-deazaguanine synthase